MYVSEKHKGMPSVLTFTIFNFYCLLQYGLEESCWRKGVKPLLSTTKVAGIQAKL